MLENTYVVVIYLQKNTGCKNMVLGAGGGSHEHVRTVVGRFFRSQGLDVLLVS